MGVKGRMGKGTGECKETDMQEVGKRKNKREGWRNERRVAK